jgi:hydrogenase-4 component E
VIQFIIVLFALTMFYVASASRIEAYIKAIAIQGVLLFLLVLLDYESGNLANLFFIIFETLAIKAVLIPVVLIKSVRKNGIHREIEPYIPNFFSLIIASAIFGLGFYAAYLTSKGGVSIRPFYFGVSISTIVTGLFFIITRKKIITHVMGFMLMENGIFLLSLAASKEMPFVVALGVLLDIFMAVYLLGLFVNKIHDTFEEVHVDTLQKLKD